MAACVTRGVILSLLALAHAKPEASLLERLEAFGTDDSAEMQIHEIQIKGSTVNKVLILGTSHGESQQRVKEIMGHLDRHQMRHHAEVVEGINAHSFQNELDEAMQNPVQKLNPQQLEEWKQQDDGTGLVHHGKPLNECKSSGALACSLGHYKMWLIARTAPLDTWTVILEDDARVSPRFNFAELTADLKNAAGADEVFLDDTHCEGRQGGRVSGLLHGDHLHRFAYTSAAYAVTPKGAAELVATPFKYNADHWLNVPVREGRMSAFCPASPLFTHKYLHHSIIENRMKLLLHHNHTEHHSDHELLDSDQEPGGHARRHRHRKLRHKKSFN